MSCESFSTGEVCTLLPHPDRLPPYPLMDCTIEGGLRRFRRTTPFDLGTFLSRQYAVVDALGNHWACPPRALRKHRSRQDWITLCKLNALPHSALTVHASRLSGEAS